MLITADHEISYQQNLAGRKLALLVLSTNNWEAIKTNVALIAEAVDAATLGSYTEVEIPSE